MLYAKNILKNYWVIGVACILIFPSLFFAFRNQESVEDKLVVGTNSAYAPWSYINDQGEWDGFDVGVAKAIAKKLNKKLVLKDYSLDASFIALESNKIDLIIYAVSITKKRLAQMAMVQYVGGATTTYPLLFWKQIPEGIKSIDDLCVQNATVCVEPGSVQEQFMQQFAKLQLKQLGSIPDMVLDLRFGKATAAIVEPALLPSLLAKSPELVVLDIPLPDDYQEFGEGICIKKTNTTFISNIERVVAQLKDDGTIEQLKAQYNIRG